jgi:putative membrane protein
MVMVMAMFASLANAQERQETEKRSDLSSSDAEFLKKASQGGMLETKLGRLAAERATNESVKKFARMMVDDHSKVVEEIKLLAEKKNVTIKDDLDEDHKPKYDELSQVADRDFDREYIEKMIDTHENSLERYKEMMKDASDADVRRFADKTRSVIERHLGEAKRIKETLKEVGSQLN